MVAIGSDAKREVEDMHLSRYACYLIVQNADPTKEVIALGQTYFAVQTRRQEISDADALAELTEDQRRLLLRQRIKLQNTDLASAAKMLVSSLLWTLPFFKITAIAAYIMV